MPEAVTAVEITPLHILRLEVANVKRIKALEIIPNGDLVVLSGKNDQGKSSALDSIEYVFCGKGAICERPIRDGASKAHVICELKDLIITRKWTAGGGSTLSVTSSNGTPLKSPQELLDKLCAGGIGFDPLSFTRMSPRDQIDTLRKLVGLDFTVLDGEKEKRYTERTGVNRDLATSKGKLANYPLHESAPATEVSIKDISTELEKVTTRGEELLAAARDKNKENARIKTDWETSSTRVASIQSSINDVDVEISSVTARLEKLKIDRERWVEARNMEAEKAKSLEQAVAALVYEDEQAIRSATTEARKPLQNQILEADSINDKVRANKRRKEIEQEIANQELLSRQLTNSIEAIEFTKKKAMQEAKFPLPGLSFDDSGVLLNGVPFTQGSQARQLQAAVAIGLALNPRLRVVIVRDGSLLDDESMKLMAEIAREKEAQIWIERVGETAGGIVIEDGQIKE